MAGLCSAHKEYMVGCPQCEAVKPEEIRVKVDLFDLATAYLCNAPVGLERLRKAGIPANTETEAVSRGRIEMQRDIDGVIFIWRDDDN